MSFCQPKNILLKPKCKIYLELPFHLCYSVSTQQILTVCVEKAAMVGGVLTLDRRKDWDVDDEVLNDEVVQ